MKLMPCEYKNSIFEIDMDALSQKGIKAFIFDIDNTLTEHNIIEVDDQTVQWLQKVKDAGFSLALMSNNSRKRVTPTAEILDVPFFCLANKPLKTTYKKACEMFGLKPHEVCMVGDQLFTDILGGNISGMYTILVRPRATAEDFKIKIKRGLERFVLSRRKW